MFQLILFFLVALYTILLLACAIAALRSRYDTDTSLKPTVSIIIAARNEEKNIRACLESVLRLVYPTHLLEVIVVDDRSTDATRAIVYQCAQQHPHIRLLVAAPRAGHMRGKTNAVSQGIEASRGEILMFTDADCTVPAHWVDETVRHYADERVGIVGGFTALRATRWFASVQALDWFFLFTIAAGAIRVHFPVTAIGNNLSVRRKAYDQVGGYQQIPFSVTEDYALFHAVTTKTPYVSRFPMDRAALVESNACSTWKELYRQKMRWFTGGRDVSASRMILFALAYLFHIFLLLSALFSGFDGFWPALAFKGLTDVLVTIPSVHTFRRWKLLLYFPLFELYFMVYVLFFPLLVLFGSEVVWKERTFDK